MVPGSPLPCRVLFHCFWMEICGRSAWILLAQGQEKWRITCWKKGMSARNAPGYLYMELKRRESEEFLTLGIGIRARKSKKLESWYFCLTDGRRVGKDFFLYKEGQNKIACTKLELRNRIGDGGQVMDSQGEYAQCVNRLLFGFETMEEYKELLDLLIQLRTPKLSKDLSLL